MSTISTTPFPSRRIEPLYFHPNNKRSTNTPFSDHCISVPASTLVNNFPARSHSRRLRHHLYRRRITSSRASRLPPDFCSDPPPTDTWKLFPKPVSASSPKACARSPDRTVCTRRPVCAPQFRLQQELFGRWLWWWWRRGRPAQQILLRSAGRDGVVDGLVVRPEGIVLTDGLCGNGFCYEDH